MKMPRFSCAALMITSLFVGLCGNAIAGVHRGHGAHWGYEGNVGPYKWGSLAEEYALCGEGKSQSPVDISMNGNVVIETGGIKFHYNDTPLAIVNNGHTVQVNCKSDSFINIGAEKYKLLQFHFHCPSENMVEGRHYNMEAHFIHKNEDGRLAVIAVFLRAGKENAFIKTLWDNLPAEVNKEIVVENISVNAADLLPRDGSYYHFTGSLTEPPCSEYVSWNVLKTPVEVSKNQINKFLALIGQNARPVQPLFARSVIEINTGEIDLGR
ncbi:MAG: carbonic anhydrase [Candidatus Anammoxibacter sp.]